MRLPECMSRSFARQVKSRGPGRREAQRSRPGCYWTLHYVADGRSLRWRERRRKTDLTESNSRVWHPMPRSAVLDCCAPTKTAERHCGYIDVDSRGLEAPRDVLFSTTYLSRGGTEGRKEKSNRTRVFRRPGFSHGASDIDNLGIGTIGRTLSS